MDKIRISASSLVKIILDDKFLLCLNKGSLINWNNRIYTPFGGAIEFYESSRSFLESLEAEFEKRNDLRIFIPKSNIPKFEDWFYRKQGRETSPYRELNEEFVNEEKIFNNLPEEEVNLTYLHTIIDQGKTHKPEISGTLTIRFSEIYEAKFNKKYENQIRKNLKEKDTHLILVTPEQITNNHNPNLKIGGNSKYLLNNL
ncbi:MAG: hypothetical protein PHE43_03710 [Candidatus Nanoarchaeia archaeon]|nr:hypothetical protein [Candidatus Nanoarchaeia archaeon]